MYTTKELAQSFAEAVDDYGLVLNTNHLHLLSAKLLDNFTEKEWENDKYGCVEEVVDKLGIKSIGDFSGEAFAINDNGESDWSNTDIYSGDSIYYVGISVYPSLFRCAYRDIDELITEFKGKIGEYLPDNFDYRSSVRHIVGTYFG